MATDNDRLEEALIQSIRDTNDVNKSSAIRIAKAGNLMKQDGDDLVLTEKGLEAAKRAAGEEG